MRCSHCGEEIASTIVGVKMLMCPECGGDLVQLDLVFSQEELELFNAVIDKAIEDTKFRQKLLKDIRGILTEAGIREESIDKLFERVPTEHPLILFLT
jgi:transcription elongation factor Elf1